MDFGERCSDFFWNRKTDEENSELIRIFKIPSFFEKCIEVQTIP